MITPSIRHGQSHPPGDATRAGLSFSFSQHITSNHICLSCSKSHEGQSFSLQPVQEPDKSHPGCCQLMGCLLQCPPRTLRVTVLRVRTRSENFRNTAVPFLSCTNSLLFQKLHIQPLQPFFWGPFFLPPHFHFCLLHLTYLCTYFLLPELDIYLCLTPWQYEIEQGNYSQLIHPRIKFTFFFVSNTPWAIITQRFPPVGLPNE